MKFHFSTLISYREQRTELVKLTTRNFDPIECRGSSLKNSMEEAKTDLRIRRNENAAAPGVPPTEKTKKGGKVGEEMEGLGNFLR